MSAAAENGRAPGGGPAAALPCGAVASYRSHLVAHVRVLQAAVDEFADAGLQRRTRVLQTLRSLLREKSERMWKGLLTLSVVHNEQSPPFLDDQGAANRSKLLARSRYQITIIFRKLGVNSDSASAAMEFLVQKRRYTSRSSFKLRGAWTADA